MATAGDITVKFGVDLADFEKKIIKAEKNLKQMGERFERIGSGMTSLVTGPLAGFAASMTALAVKSGAVEKEQKKLEASMDKLGASVADVVGPAFAAAADVVGDMAKRFSEMDTETKKTIVQVGLVVAAIGPLSTGFGKMIKTVAELSVVMRGAVVWLAAHPWIALGAAVAALTIKMVAFNETSPQKKLEQDATAAQAAVKHLLKRAEAVGVNTERGKEFIAMARDYHNKAQGITEKMVESAQATDTQSAAMDNLAVSTEKAAKAGEDWIRKYADAVVSNFAAAQDAMAANDAALRELTDPTQGPPEAIKAVSQAKADVSPLTREIVDGIGTGLSGGLPSLMSGAVDMMIPGLGGALQPIFEALAQSEDQARATLTAMLDGFITQFENIAKNVGVIFDVIIRALPELIMLTFKQIPWMIASIAEMLGGLFQDIGQWIGQAIKDAGQWVGDAFRSVFEDIINWFIDILNKIPGVSIAHVGDRRGGGDPMAYLTALANAEPRAVGGPVNAGSPYLVGERGPELFVPQASGAIMPNDAMGAITINIQGGRDDAETIARKTVRAIRDARRLGLLDVNMLAGVGSA